MKLISAILSVLAWVLVGLFAAQFIPRQAAMFVGFVAFVFTAAHTYPRARGGNA